LEQAEWPSLGAFAASCIEVMSRGDRCVVFFREGYIGVQPTVANLARFLDAAGYDVTVYTSPVDAPDAGDLGGVHLEVLRTAPLLERLGDLGHGRFRLWKVARRLWPEGERFAWRAFREEQRRRPRGRRTVYVGVDVDGALAALLCARALGGSYIFLSLELKAIAQLRSGLRGLMARQVYRQSAGVTVQGRDRLGVLTRELRWEHPNVFILPNSPYSAQSSPAAFDFRARLGIPAGARVALQAGMINDTACAMEVARGFEGVAGWALVLHERLKRSADEPYMTQLRSLNGSNLYLSLDPVPYDQVDAIFAAADVGLCFYKPYGEADENFRLISSSGKLTHYLKHGKPVLVSDVPPLVEVVEAYRCGLVVKDPSNREEIQQALRSIADRYDDFSENARRCFVERYDFGRAMKQLAGFMDTL
jgi:glycosyltransferase involved in cell wall biosynthesis